MTAIGIIASNDDFIQCGNKKAVNQLRLTALNIFVKKPYCRNFIKLIFTPFPFAPSFGIL